MDDEKIPPNKQSLKEALSLSEEILTDIELNKIPLTNIALKISRLSRLLNDFDHQQIMEYEAGGYPSTPDGISKDVLRLLKIAGRTYISDEEGSEGQEWAYWNSIESLEGAIKISETHLIASKDPPISIGTPNIHSAIYGPHGNADERMSVRRHIYGSMEKLASRKRFLYAYTSQKYYELKYSSISDDVFSRIRSRVDSKIGALIPNSQKKFVAIYDNLNSTNPEDWSNAVHSCRRILQDLADALSPPREDIKREKNGKGINIKMGKENYINRMVFFIESHSESERFSAIVGSHVEFIGNRLDSIFQAAQKGSHDLILTKEEAERYVVYTYLIVGDILTLKGE